MMSEKEYHRMKKAIKKALRKSHGSRIVLFGARGIRGTTKQIIDILREEGRFPVAIIDNDTRKQHSLYFGVMVYAPEEALLPFRPDTVIFTCSSFEREMTAQAMRMGYKDSQIYNFYKVLSGETEFSKISSVMRGASLYRRMKTKYGQSASVILSPYIGNGDIYLIGTFLNGFSRCHDIKEYVLVVVGRACAKVARIFDVKNIEQISYDECEDICNAYIFVPELLPELHIMNGAFLYTSNIRHLSGYKKINFTDMVRIGIFGASTDYKPEIPAFEETPEIAGFIKERELNEKSILISPYTNSLPELPPEMWDRLATRLSEMGYRILTNSSGESEPVIEGTEGIFFPLDQAVQILNHMGGFIGVRSGFCDIASAAKCKKIILYDEANAYYLGTALDYFSLNGMELCDDAYEFTYKNDEQSIAELIEKIIGVIAA